MASPHITPLEHLIEEETSPPISNLEETIEEDSFYIRFTVEEHGSMGSSPDDTENLLMIKIFDVFESPFIIPCSEVLQNVPEFLHNTVSDYLSERDLQSLAFEITSSYQRVQYATGETTPPHRLIPLNVHFNVDSAFGQYAPLFYVLEHPVLQHASPYEDHHQDMIDNVNDDSELTEIFEAIDQSMQQLSLVPASEEAMASLKKIKMPHEEIKADICSICLENFDDGGADVSATPCDHFYHNICIVKWLETSHTCPLCRYQMSTI
ncbi:hypothetical protein QN277_011724 [Acacia crassicarpa]|uniref:RING-type E3 ubiquitin transferase n=1 Tax=Acacia crassicarpa TaxID=499986 RepID=A0AAE1MZT0_9FABA|nr:hypothetical protein QN277_011724 [Acacia crassicarpa]